jgi:PAS domain S-box-containing protein
VEQVQRLTDEVNRRLGQIAAINSLAAAVSQSLDLEKTLQTALQVVMNVIDVEATGISLIDTRSNELVLRAQRGWKRDFVKMGMRMPAGHGLSWYVIEHDEVVVTGDVANDPRIKHQAFQEEGIKAQALAPMHARGVVTGVLSAMSYNAHEFAAEELTTLAAIADQIGVALDNARLFSQVSTEKSRLTQIVDSTADAIVAIGVDAYITICNPAADQLLGAVGRLIVDKPVSESGLHEALVRGLQEAADRKKDTPEKFEITIDRPANKTILSCVVSPVKDEQEALQGWVAVLRDITHLRAADDLKTQVIQTAAHDIRSPVSAAESALNLLTNTIGEPTPIQRKLLDSTYEGLNRVYRLIDNLLNIERIENGLVLDEDVNLGDLIWEVISEMGGGLEDRHLSFSVEIAKPIPAFRGSAIWLERAVANYLHNAAKYTPDGGTISIRLFHEQGEIQFEVEDGGPGIPLEAQTRLFERFYRIPQKDDSKRLRGSGLGLSIVKLIIQQHGGRVYVRSQPGQGSIFGFALPAMS